MSVSIIMFDTFKKDFKKAYPNEEFKIEDVNTMNEIIETLYHTKNYEIDNEYHILELY